MHITLNERYIMSMRYDTLNFTYYFILLITILQVTIVFLSPITEIESYILLCHRVINLRTIL